MRQNLAVIGDIHGRTDMLEDVLIYMKHICKQAHIEEPKGILLVGDIGRGSCRGRWTYNIANKRKAYERWRDSCIQVFELLEAYDKECLYVPGNHDFYELPTIMDGIVPRTYDIEKMRCVDRKQIEFFGWKVGGIGGNPNTKSFGWPYEMSEDQAFKIVENVGDGIDILVSHTPPFGICDLTSEGENAGSEAVRHWCDRHIKWSAGTPILVCGHIHEAYGVASYGNVRVLNAGAFGPPHPSRNVGIIEPRESGESAVSIWSMPDDLQSEHLYTINPEILMKMGHCAFPDADFHKFFAR